MKTPTDKITVEQEFAEYQNQITKLEQQLAAEREELADAEILCRDLQRNRDEIHRQLAAEQEKAKQLENGWLDLIKQINAALAKTKL